MTEVNELIATLEQTPVLVFSMDKAGKVLSLLGLEAQQLGLDSSLIGQTLFKNSNFPCKRSYFKRALAGGKFSATFNINGIIYETFFTPHTKEDGSITGVIGLSIDVTKRIEVEQSLDDERFRATAAQWLNSLAPVEEVVHDEVFGFYVHG